MWIYNVVVALESAPSLTAAARIRHFLRRECIRCTNLRTTAVATICDLRLRDKDMSAELRVTDDFTGLTITVAFCPESWEGNADMTLAEREYAETDFLTDRVRKLLGRSPWSIDDINVVDGEIWFHCFVETKALSGDTLAASLKTICGEAP